MTPRVPEVDVSQISTAAEKPPYILDVREDDEWDAGHIDGTQHIPMMEIPARLAEISTDEQVLVICRSGSRSALVVGFLKHQGVDAVNVAGGIQVWAALGRPMTGPPGQPAHVI
jgi:rhodanese-related sulfurtransferase